MPEELVVTVVGVPRAAAARDGKGDAGARDWVAVRVGDQDTRRCRHCTARGRTLVIARLDRDVCGRARHENACSCRGGEAGTVEREGVS